MSRGNILRDIEVILDRIKASVLIGRPDLTEKELVKIYSMGYDLGRHQE